MEVNRSIATNVIIIILICRGFAEISVKSDSHQLNNCEEVEFLRDADPEIAQKLLDAFIPANIARNLRYLIDDFFH